MKPPPLEWPEYDTSPKQLSDLYPAGTPMSEVHPDFRGMSLERWQMLKIQEQCTERYEQWLKQFFNGVITEEARTMGKRIATPRDSYGWRS